MTFLNCIRINSAIHLWGCALSLLVETPTIFEGRSLDPCFRRAAIRLKEVTPGRRDYESLMLEKDLLSFQHFALKR